MKRFIFLLIPIIYTNILFAQKAFYIASYDQAMDFEKGTEIISINGRQLNDLIPGRMQFVGQETGGAYAGNNSGTFVIVTLPNSRLCVGIPMVGYYMAVPPIQPFDRGVLPTIEITPNIQQIINKEDVCLEWALENI